MGKNFRETFAEQMNAPVFRTEWEAQEPEQQIIRAIIEGKAEHNPTQKQLAETTGVTQTDFSRPENGTANSSLSILKRLAADTRTGLQMYLFPPPLRAD